MAAADLYGGGVLPGLAVRDFCHALDIAVGIGDVGGVEAVLDCVAEHLLLHTAYLAAQFPLETKSGILGDLTEQISVSAGQDQPKKVLKTISHRENAVIIGRSHIVGRPMHKLLLDANMNVTILHTRTSEEDKRFYLEHADLIVVAAGKAGVLNKSYKLNI